jgi:hypothetical protein
MNNLQSIRSQINETLHSLEEWNNLEQFVGEFHLSWLKLGNIVQQQLVQARVDQKESQYQSPRTKRKKRYYTPLGEIVVKRRAYITADGIKVKVDEELGLPKNKWLPMVLELACALGVSSEFTNSHRLFQRWTGLEITEKTLANQVEQTGNQLQTQEFNCSKKSITQSQFESLNQSNEKSDLLDFFHLSEYVWKVAKLAYPKDEQKQKDWVNIQQNLLKQSKWKTVIQNSSQLKRKKPDLIKAITDLERYLTNNQSRIDYQSYLKAGLMIGSGVVESSNRRVVTQRLKQAGMHWSKIGAEGVMALRAAYLSNSNRWLNFWSSESRIFERKLA